MPRAQGFRDPRVQANPDIGAEFRARFPQQTETCLRLTMERLQTSLSRGSTATVPEIAALAQAAQALHSIWYRTHAVQS